MGCLFIFFLEFTKTSRTIIILFLELFVFDRTTENFSQKFSFENEIDHQQKVLEQKNSLNIHYLSTKESILHL